MNDTASHAEPAIGSRELGHTRRPVGGHGPFLPLLLMGVALFGWTGFQTVELAKAHSTLEGVIAAQQRQVVRSQRLRAALSTLASDTQKLADAGDPGAQLIVKQLRQRGITIHPGAKATAPPP